MARTAKVTRKRPKKRTTKPTAKKSRRFVDIAVVVWDDASHTDGQDHISNFDNGLEIVTVGHFVHDMPKSAKYISLVSDNMPDITQVRGFHSIPKAIVKKVRRVRVYL